MRNPENSLQRSVKVQNDLFNPFCGQDGLEHRVSQAKKGHLPFGVSLENLAENTNRNSFKDILGEFAPKVLILTNPDNPKTLLPEQIAVAGGWCVLRIADTHNLNQGIIANPETGKLEEVSSVEQVASWIGRSAAFDQVIECIGGVKSVEMIAISEVRLWSERIVSKLEEILGRSLTFKEEDRIFTAVEETENRRFQMTDRYLQYILGEDSSLLTRIVDAEIWEDLEKARDELLKVIGTTPESLSDFFSKPLKNIQSRSLIWAMYSEPYFRQLKKRGVLNSAQEKILIVEPILHTYGTSKADNYVVRSVYQDKGVYFDPEGINKNTGYIAFVECLTPNGKSVRRFLNTGSVPNVSNWEMMFMEKDKRILTDNSLIGSLRPENNRVINPVDNNLFVWGVNFLPFGRTQEALLALTNIQARFQKEKKKLKSKFTSTALRKDLKVRESMQTMVGELKEECFVKVDSLNRKIEADLRNLFEFITGEN